MRREGTLPAFLRFVVSPVGTRVARSIALKGAYASLAGFPPFVGLNASILPFVVHPALDTSPSADRRPAHDSFTVGRHHHSGDGARSGRADCSRSAPCGIGVGFPYRETQTGTLDRRGARMRRLSQAER